MTQTTRDDLFENSTMSFGEHLEELRGALGRALVGIVIGFFVALPLADNAVRFISTPLERALAKVELERNELRLRERGDFAIEDWHLLHDERHTPLTVKVDLGQLADQLREMGALPPATEGSLADKLGIADHLTPAVTAAVARKLHDVDTQFAAETARAVRKRLTPEEMEQAAIACQRRISATAEQRAAIRQIINRLSRESDLYADSAFAKLKPLFPLASQRGAIERLRTRAIDGKASPQEIQQLQLWLLAAALDVPELAPRSTVVDLRVWQPVNVTIQSLSVQEPFMIVIKAAVVLGLILASPWVFVQIWNFVAAGLYPNERNYVYTYLPFSLGLFFLGAAVAFFFVFDPVLDFLFSFNLMMNVDAVPRLNEWLSFVLFLPVGFGLSFQLPLVMLMLERIGVFSVDDFLSKWRVSVLVIFALSMFLTPSDPMSMLLMGVPLTVLYFGGILLCQYMPRGRSPIGPGYDPA